MDGVSTNDVSFGAGGESGGYSAAKLFVVIVGEGAVGRNTAAWGGVVRRPRDASARMKPVLPSSFVCEDGVRREGLPLLWIR